MMRQITDHHSSLVSPEVQPRSGPRREGTVRVRDGRAVGFAEWGDASGAPVVAFHGCPGSRLMGVGREELADELGLRIVVLERPGFGLSEFAADRTLLCWADDVADATRALGIDQFFVVGVSAGSASALACGARLSSRIEAVGVIAGIAPPGSSGEDEFADLIEHDRREAEEAARRHFEAMAADVDASVAEMAARAGPDHAVYSPDVQERFRETRREAFRTGSDGAVVDLLLLHQPWDFELRDIVVATHWWHGSLDPIVPLHTVREATTGMRDFELTVFENEGHAIGFAHSVEILTSLAQLN